MSRRRGRRKGERWGEGGRETKTDRPRYKERKLGQVTGHGCEL